MEMDSSNNSKRKRTSDGKQIAISWPSISLKFVSKENEKRYHASLSRNLIFERGIDLIDIVEDDILDVVTDRVWFNFVAQPKDACENLVREFYANFVEEDFNEGRGILLRGTMVNITPSKINQYFELSHERCCLDNLCFSKEDLATNLSNSKATWPSNNNYLPHGHLFCSCSLDPSTDRSEINLRRAKLIYAIEKSDTFMSPPPMLDSKVLKEIACPVARRVSQDTPTTLPSRSTQVEEGTTGKLKRAMLQFLVDLIVLKQVMPLYLIGLINKVLKLVCFQGIRD
ncbi:hypothetical protein LWI28_002801 [Acer negundo]|uniref:Putative plant transposon protein domain-containing protein n=1 Tax=Acer negundo TaxID=4023 RepID=A0AAD5JI36_ACENE|nr:hypothetical protein LWI28_002801 [Acer negundo]